MGNQDSSVGIATICGLDGRVPAVRLTQRCIKWVQGAVSSGLTRQEREADQFPPSGSEVK
jgi:hypothetical protein